MASWLPISIVDFVGLDTLLRADGKIDRSETVGAPIDQVAEKEDHAPRAAAGLAGRLIQKRLQQIRTAVNVADGKNLESRSDGPRQMIGVAGYDCGHSDSRGRA